MPLTPDEEKKLREEIRRKLEERERREKQSKQKSEEERRRQLEERLRIRIREEEEEKFYTERGYVRYKNRHGEMEWITAEEAERRAGTRRSRKPSSHRQHKKKARIRLALNLAALFLVLVVAALIYKYNPGRGPKTGHLVVSSDVTGALIYLDGEATKYFTPDTLEKLPVGKHVATVYKEGFSVYPPMAPVAVEKNKLARIQFRLSNTNRLGTVRLVVSEPYASLYVDGLRYQMGKNGISQVPYGYHTFMVVKKGFLASPAYRRVFVAPDDTTEVDFELLPDQNIGYLQVTDNLFKGHIFLDRKFSGMQASADLLPVRSGTYEVRVRKNGFRCLPDSQMINILPGETRMVVFRLEPVAERVPVKILAREPGANIILDGEFTPYVTPIAELPVSPGKHYLNLMRGNQVYSQKEKPLYVGRNTGTLFFDF